MAGNHADNDYDQERVRAGHIHGGDAHDHNDESVRATNPGDSGAEDQARARSYHQHGDGANDPENDCACTDHSYGGGPDDDNA